MSTVTLPPDAPGEAEPRPAPLLEVDGLVVEFATSDGVVRAVDGLSWHVDAGETLAVVGESGSGKSVSSLAVMGLLQTPPARVVGGAVRFAGTDLLQLPRAEHRAYCGEHVAMVFQDALAALNPVYTVGFQLTEALVARKGTSRREARRRAIELLDLVRVPSARQRVKEFPHQFSGGMRQRVVLAMALAMDPQVLIADEPTTALDVTVQAQIMALLAEIQAERQMALVLITHDLGVVASVADRVTVMYAGRAVEQAPVLETFHQPSHPYTAALLRSVPRLDGELGDDAELDVIPGRPPELVDLPPGCSFHPRCPRALDLCRVDPPPALRLVGPAQRAACHVAEAQLADSAAEHAAVAASAPEDVAPTRSGARPRAQDPDGDQEVPGG
ncbi:ABC transporter ATP-binding protein [Auraticoccus monumenti]|uniref:Oligopeptide transport system ATP-binding protein n=1 Tax=Auraticoccus monumenti TaxID=675864 RepID=A0A1G6V3Q8_9ACTN|nr:ABC transporter ATP-binding protein [Auraticoccus monumenti]SDD48188.1 oligopeptide transport system ATP-binding protein [Auraticoccus monumenti]